MQTTHAPPPAVEALEDALTPGVPLTARPLVSDPNILSEEEAKRLHHARLPFEHRDRVPKRYDLPAAYRHFQTFRQDKEKTSEIFKVFECLPWLDVDQAARNFLATERGQQIYANEPFLPDLLDDHDRLRRFPKGSLAHEYSDYMEQEGLSAAGLLDEFDQSRTRPRIDDRIEWYVDRLRDTHDLLHILTGFGRDTLGEQCLAAFVSTQRKSLGHIVLGFGGAFVMLRNLETGAPFFRATLEAYRLGKRARRINEESILELLAMPTQAVRDRLNLREPHYYNECQRVWVEQEGVDPQQVLAKQ